MYKWLRETVGGDNELGVGFFWKLFINGGGSQN